MPGRMRDVIIIAQLRARLAGIYPVYPHVCVKSWNNFPTAAGLASSASGLAALAFGLVNLYGLKNEDDTFELARRGSGSACRSIFGGFVHWQVDSEVKIGSVCRPLYDSSHWGDMRVLICMTCDRTKPITSRAAMEQTVKTSILYRHGRQVGVSSSEVKLLEALRNRDFPAFGEVAMRESNQLHAVCLDTWPPCAFLNTTSLSIMNMVHKLNQSFGRIWVAYTFDAGPNAFLFALQQDVPLLLRLLVLCFGHRESSEPAVDGDKLVASNETGELRELAVCGEPYQNYDGLIDSDLLNNLPHQEGALLRVISTKVGDGPRLLKMSNT